MRYDEPHLDDIRRSNRRKELADKKATAEGMTHSEAAAKAWAEGYPYVTRDRRGYTYHRFLPANLVQTSVGVPLHPQAENWGLRDRDHIALPLGSTMDAVRSNWRPAHEFAEGVLTGAENFPEGTSGQAMNLPFGGTYVRQRKGGKYQYSRRVENHLRGGSRPIDQSKSRLNFTIGRHIAAMDLLWPLAHARAEDLLGGRTPIQTILLERQTWRLPRPRGDQTKLPLPNERALLRKERNQRRSEGKAQNP